VRLYLTLAIVFVGVVVLANWLASQYTIHVLFTPYMAPAGVYMIGGILVLRDWLQQAYGLLRTMPLVLVAGLISLAAGYAFGYSTLAAVAWGSMAAFLASETVEALVFTPIRRRSLTLSVALSATIGIALDSWIFLTIAFGSLAFFPGQFWGKLTAVAVGVTATAGRRRIIPA
jgi:uncharacterized PurR-regulated membrane protein YhhQ (DUF165 family)